MSVVLRRAAAATTPSSLGGGGDGGGGQGRANGGGGKSPTNNANANTRLAGRDASYSRSMLLLQAGTFAVALGVLVLNAAFLHHGNPATSPPHWMTVRRAESFGGGGTKKKCDCSSATSSTSSSSFAARGGCGCGGGRWPEIGDHPDRSPEYVIGPTYRFLSDADANDPSNPTPPACSLTAVFTDPRLPIFPSSDDAYARAIESVAHYTPDDSCIVLQTSGCILNQQQHRDDPKDEDVTAMIPESEWFGEVARRIYDRAHPHLRSRIDAGRVRLTLLNATKYNLDSCSNFANVTLAYANIHYLVDEFIDGVESDLTLFFQRDTFLCRPLLVDNWREAGYAWVGYPWRLGKGSWGPVKRMWNKNRFTIQPPQRRSNDWNVEAWRRYWDEHGDVIDDKIRRGVEPALVEFPPEVVFPNRFPAAFSRRGQVGNGGLSLRSLKWLRRAVRVCPCLPQISGLDAEVVDANACSSPKYYFDDVYYSSLMGVIGAPVPDVFDAAVFCSECFPMGTPWIWDSVLPLRGGGGAGDGDEAAARGAAEVKRNETVARYRGPEGLIDFWHTAHRNKKTYGDNGDEDKQIQKIGEGEPVVAAPVSIGYHQCQRCGQCPPTDLCRYSPRDVLLERAAAAKKKMAMMG